MDINRNRSNLIELHNDNIVLLNASDIIRNQRNSIEINRTYGKSVEINRRHWKSVAISIEFYGIQWKSINFD